MTQGPIIAICGAPGAGKSRLAKGLSVRMGCELISYDTYETFTRSGPETVQEWISRGSPYSEIETPGLSDALRVAAAHGPVVFDTPLGRAHPQTGKLIDKAVWIDCPADLALSRKVAQLADTVPTARAGAFVDWLKGYLAQYELIVRPACALQLARVKPLCEVCVDAHHQVDYILDGLVDQLNER
ncbi:AAA family ATPase [Sulfitobacter sp.]|uniref:AAA family ATPase n=1 Tax=Sulfitobacter sp. TaxID=1903071 RepID=UPI003002E0E4